MDYFFEKNVPTYQVNVDVTGGGEKTSYYISGSYFYQEGTAPMSDYERYTFRSNTDSQVKDCYESEQIYPARIVSPETLDIHIKGLIV